SATTSSKTAASSSSSSSSSISSIPRTPFPYLPPSATARLTADQLSSWPIPHSRISNIPRLLSLPSILTDNAELAMSRACELFLYHLFTSLVAVAASEVGNNVVRPEDFAALLRHRIDLQ